MSTYRPASLVKAVIGEKKKKQLQYLALRAKQAVGVPPFTGWQGLDRKVVNILNHKRDGFFIEAGGNDGISQSNTYFLEAKLGWNGILIEPIHELATLARSFRRCQVYECALGSPEMAGSKVSLSFSDLKSSVSKAPPVRWNGVFGPNPQSASAIVRTLSEVIDEHGNPDIDLLSLDVEGFEMTVLEGLDLRRHSPRMVLIETARIEAINAFLTSRYEMSAQLSHHDYLFTHR